MMQYILQKVFKLNKTLGFGLQSSSFDFGYSGLGLGTLGSFIAIELQNGVMLYRISTRKMDLESHFYNHKTFP